MKILIKATAGSHLFGTNTPSSDTDFKGVFLPTSDQILLGTYKESVSYTTGDDKSRNGKDDSVDKIIMKNIRPTGNIL